MLGRSNLRNKIENRWRSYEEDIKSHTNYLGGDREEISGLLSRYRQHFISFLNFYNYNYSLKLERARYGPLDPYIEKALKHRADEVASTYNSLVKIGEMVLEICNRTNLLPVFNKHSSGLFEFLYHDARFGTICEAFRDMGASEAQISWMIHNLQRKSFNPLLLGKGDGTFEGAIRRLAGQRDYFVGEMTALKSRGMVIFEGAMPSPEVEPQPNTPPEDNCEGDRGYVCAAIVVAICLIIILLW